MVWGALIFTPQPAASQFAQEGPKLIGNDFVLEPMQGYSVSLSADGNTAIVGGFRP